MLAQFAFMLTEGGLPLEKLGFPFLKPPIPIAELGTPTAELAFLIEVSNQLLLNQIDEEIDFLLVVTALADARPGESDIVDISRSENHSPSPGVSDATGNAKCRGPAAGG